MKTKQSRITLEEFNSDNLVVGALYKFEVPYNFDLDVGQTLWFSKDDLLFHTEGILKKEENTYRGVFAKYKIWYNE